MCSITCFLEVNWCWFEGKCLEAFDYVFEIPDPLSQAQEYGFREDAIVRIFSRTDDGYVVESTYTL